MARLLSTGMPVLLFFRLVTGRVAVDGDPEDFTALEQVGVLGIEYCGAMIGHCGFGVEARGHQSVVTMMSCALTAKTDANKVKRMVASRWMWLMV